MSTAQTAAKAGVTAGQATVAYGVATGANWVPIVGPIVAGVALALGIILARKGPEQKRITTEIVNELEPLLQQNLEGYFTGPRTRASQEAALANFDAAWRYLTSAQACGNPELGEPGQRCITDRAPGGQWDWWAYYRDPIAQDTPAPDLALPSEWSVEPLLLAGVAAVALGLAM